MEITNSNLENPADADDLQNPIDKLNELGEVYETLPENSAERLDFLTNIGSGADPDIISGILYNWDIYEKMLCDYSNSSGSVMNNASVYADSLDGSLNQLKNTWIELVGNVADSKGLTLVTNALNELLQTVNSIIDGAGQLASLGTIAGAASGAKNLGKYA